MKGIYWWNRVEHVLDTIIICLVLYILCYTNKIVNYQDYAIMSLSGAFVFRIISQCAKSDQSILNFPSSYYLINIIRTWILTFIGIVIILFILKISNLFSRFVLSLWLVITPFAIYSINILVKKVISYVCKKEIYRNTRVAIFGDGEVVNRLSNIIKTSRYLGIELIKVYRANELDQCICGAVNSEFDRLYIVKKTGEQFESEDLLYKLSNSSVILYYVPDLFGIELVHSTWSKIGNIDVLSINDSPIQGSNLFLKRFIDINLSIIILIIILPILLAVAILIKLTSKGPVLFKQSRYGLNGREIKVWKFRSMSVCENNNITQTVKNDLRVTKIGALIRRTSIDELPQFFNVLSGSMSIVGPRPHAVQHNEEFRKLIPHYMRRHVVKPGITGWAQVSGWRGETDTDEKIIKRTEYDIYYIKNWSLIFDFKIIALTFKEFFNKNAY